MAAEFLESEVMFSESDSDSDQNPQSPNNHHDFCYSYKNRDYHQTASKRKMKRSSKPLDIPNSPRNGVISSPNDEEEDCYRDENGEMVPPHLIVAMRNSVKMGSNLRGRNLREVRNSILKMTGFLESETETETD